MSGYYLCNRTVEFVKHLLLWFLFFPPLSLYQHWSLVYSLLGVKWLVAGSIKEDIWAWRGIHGLSYNRHLNIIPLTTLWVI